MLKRWTRRLLITILALVAVIAVAVVGVALTFDPNAYKPKIIEAVRRATGRELTLAGQLHMKLALHPTLTANDVSLSNAPGGTRPQMATIGRIEAQFALWPLVSGRLEIRQLDLVKPDILLETDANGTPNWRFTKPPEPVQPSKPASNTPKLQLEVRRLRLEDGTVTMYDGRTGQTIAVAINRFVVDSPSTLAPTSFDMAGAVRDVPFRLEGSVGSVDPATLAKNPDAPWPVKLSLTALGGTAQASGTIPRTAPAGGYDLNVAAVLPQLPTLAPLIPSVTLPHVTDIQVSAHVTGSGSGVPNISELTATAGQSDLAPLVPALVLTHAELKAPDQQQPLHAAADGTYRGLPFKADGTGDDIEALLGARPVEKYSTAFTIDLSGAHLRADGSIVHPLALSGLDFSVDGSVPDLAPLVPVLRTPLPALHEIAYKGTLSDTGNGLEHGVLLRDMHLQSPDADLTANLMYAPAPRPSLTGNIAAARIDLDALQTAWEDRTMPNPETDSAQPPSPAAAGTPPVTPAPQATPAPAPATVVKGANRTLPFALLRSADADIQLAAATVQSGGETWRNLRTHLLLASGKLSLDPFAADLTSGHLEGRAAIDANQSPTPVSIVLHAPGLQASPFIQGINGRLEVDADLHGVGETPHALAATASGRLGMAITNGTLQTQLIERLFAPILRVVRLPDLAKQAEQAKLTCAAVSMTLTYGVGTLRAMGLDTNLFTMSGTGTVNFANDTLALRVHPTAALGNGLGVNHDRAIGDRRQGCNSRRDNAAMNNLN